jgi:hypothetical protein
MLKDTTVIQAEGRSIASYPSSSDKTQRQAVKDAIRAALREPFTQFYVVVIDEDGKINIIEL